MWNRGKTTVSLPIEKLVEPDPKWGARSRDQEHVNVSFFLLLFYIVF
jgi:hypothetical protein